MDFILGIASVKTILTCVFVPILVYRFYQWLRQPSKKLPPGPRDWGSSWKLLRASLKGSLPNLAADWARKYGELTFLYSFGQPILIINSAEATRQLIASDKYKFLVADRSLAASARVVKFNGKDLIFSKFDSIMRKKRRMFYNVLGLYGNGVNKFENVVWGEMERMFTEIDNFNGEDIDISKIIARSLKVIIYILAMGECPADPSVTDILDEYDSAFNKLSRPDTDFVLNYIPFVTYLPGKFKNLVNEMLAIKNKADDLMYYDPKKTYVPGKPRGMTDLIMDYKDKPGYEWLEDEDHILALISSLYISAQLTTRSFLSSIFLNLLNNPNVVIKIQEEIDKVIAKDRPKIEHSHQMPYTEATILEELRIVPPVPVGGFRIASQDLEFQEYNIPKNTLIFMNPWYFLHDDTIWDDPWAFKPERFLDKDGLLLPFDHPKRRDLLAFGAGVRACPGDIFARSRAFIIITSILQRYDILPPEKTDNQTNNSQSEKNKTTSFDYQSDDEIVQGIVYVTPPFKCRIIPRTSKI